MKKIIITLYMLAIAFALYAQNEKLRVAVFDPTSSGTNIDEGTKVAVRELISSTFVNTGKYNIVERSLLQQVMKEQKFTNTDVVDESQATELGRLAGANKVVLSVVTLVGGRNMLSIKVIDVKTATVEQQKTKIVSSNDLLDIVEPLTLELLGKKSNTNQETKVSIQQKGNNISSDQPVANGSTSAGVDKEAIRRLKDLIHSSCKDPAGHLTDESMYRSLKNVKALNRIYTLIAGTSKFIVEPSSVNENEVSFFLRSKKGKDRNPLLVSVPIIIVFLDGEVIGFGDVSKGVHIIPENISGTHTLTFIVQRQNFRAFSFLIDLSAKKYYLFDWVTNKGIELIN